MPARVALTLFRVLAAGSLVLELVAPLTLPDRLVAQVWAASTFGMHWGIRLIMGITFRHHLSGVIYAPVVPVERLLPGWRRAIRSADVRSRIDPISRAGLPLRRLWVRVHRAGQVRMRRCR